MTDLRTPNTDRLVTLLEWEWQIDKVFPWEQEDMLGLNQWYLEAQEFQDMQMVLHDKRMEEIMRGLVQMQSGEIKLPSPRRRRKRARNGKSS